MSEPSPVPVDPDALAREALRGQVAWLRRCAVEGSRFGVAADLVLAEGERADRAEQALTDLRNCDSDELAERLPRVRTLLALLDAAEARADRQQVVDALPEQIESLLVAVETEHHMVYLIRIEDGTYCNCGIEEWPCTSPAYTAVASLRAALGSATPEPKEAGK
jgi:hypothetical protein